VIALDSPQNSMNGDLRHLMTGLGNIAPYVESLRERVGLMGAVIENFPGGISLFDCNLQMVLCNEQQRLLIDYPDELFANGFPSLEQLFRFNASRGEYGPGDNEEHVARRMALVRERKPHVYERTRPNGTIVEVRGTPLEGGGFVTTYLDVTEQRRNQALIAHMAHHDTLTNLPNRALFADRLQTAIALANRSGLAAVHYLDVDRFKPVNDQLGHAAGDALLVSVAERLVNTVRENDTVARLGGDEFAIVQTGIQELEDSNVLARRVLDAMSSPFDIIGNEVHIGASIGIALAPRDGTTVDEVLRKADAALYRSKSGGRGRFTVFETHAKEASVRSSGAMQVASPGVVATQPTVRVANRAIDMTCAPALSPAATCASSFGSD
jgi:diguanylate cyclase (GGDEF)-like protein